MAYTTTCQETQLEFGIADLEDDKVLADEHVVEIVRVDPEQDRGHSTAESGRIHILVTKNPT